MGGKGLTVSTEVLLKMSCANFFSLTLKYQLCSTPSARLTSTSFPWCLPGMHLHDMVFERPPKASVEA